MYGLMHVYLSFRNIKKQTNSADMSIFDVWINLLLGKRENKKGGNRGW